MPWFLNSCDLIRPISNLLSWWPQVTSHNLVNFKCFQFLSQFVGDLTWPHNLLSNRSASCFRSLTSFSGYSRIGTPLNRHHACPQCPQKFEPISILLSAPSSDLDIFALESQSAFRVLRLALCFTINFGKKIFLHFLFLPSKNEKRFTWSQVYKMTLSCNKSSKQKSFSTSKSKSFDRLI